MSTNTEFPNTGLFMSLGGMEISQEKKKYYFKLLKYIFDDKYHLETISKCMCGSRDLEVLSLHDRFTLPFGTLICRRCGLIQLSPRLSGKDLPNFYDEIYWGLIPGENNDELSTGDNEMGAKIYDFIKEHVLPSMQNKTISIIDIGCGNGVKLHEIKRKFELDGVKCIASGCDYSQDAVNLAEKKEYKSI